MPFLLRAKKQRFGTEHVFPPVFKLKRIIYIRPVTSVYALGSSLLILSLGHQGRHWVQSPIPRLNVRSGMQKSIHSSTVSFQNIYRACLGVWINLTKYEKNKLKSLFTETDVGGEGIKYL